MIRLAAVSACCRKLKHTYSDLIAWTTELVNEGRGAAGLMVLSFFSAQLPTNGVERNWLWVRPRLWIANGWTRERCLKGRAMRSIDPQSCWRRWREIIMTMQVRAGQSTGKIGLRPAPCGGCTPLTASGPPD